jgi:hypothetical protein
MREDLLTTIKQLSAPHMDSRRHRIGVHAQPATQRAVAACGDLTEGPAPSRIW